MDLQEPVEEAVRAELKRQAEASDGALQVSDSGESRLTVQGSVDLAALAMAVTGAVAGGP